MPRFRYTTDHAASSYGQPVLVDDETGTAYGPGDLLTMAQVASLLGVDARHARRLATAHGAGQRLGARMLVMTVAAAEGLRGKLKPGRGRPRRANEPGGV